MSKNSTSRSNEKSFCFFNCCCSKKNETEELILSKKKAIKTELSISKSQLDNLFLMFPVCYIRDDEKSIINYTKNGILEFIINLQNSEFTEKLQLENLKISVSDPKFFSKNFFILHFKIEIEKNFFNSKKTIIEVANAMTKPELRKKWDKNLKEYSIIEQINDNCEILKTVSIKQMGILEERVYFEKRARIFDKGVFYSFNSSIPENFFNLSDNTIKITSYFRILVISENKEKFIIDAYNNTNMKININDEFIEKSGKIVKEFFDEFCNYLKKE